MRYMKWIVVWCVLLTLILTACGDEDESPDKMPEARSLLSEAAGKVQNAQYFKLEIRVSGYPVPISAGGLQLPAEMMTFQNAQGAYAAPDKLSASAQFNVNDAGLGANIVAVGEEQYIQIDLLGSNWFKQAIIPGFSPAQLMAPESGIAAALKSITNVKMIGKEDLDGLDVYHLTGKIQASNVNSLTFGLIPTQNGLLDIDVYISVEDHEIEMFTLHEPLPDGVEDQAPTTWTISIFDYNEPVDIQAPVVS